MARKKRCSEWAGSQEGGGIRKANESTLPTDETLLATPMRKRASGWGWKDKDNAETISSPSR